MECLEKKLTDDKLSQFLLQLVQVMEKVIFQGNKNISFDVIDIHRF